MSKETTREPRSSAATGSPPALRVFVAQWSFRGGKWKDHIEDQTFAQVLSELMATTSQNHDMAWRIIERVVTETSHWEENDEAE